MIYNGSGRLAGTLVAVLFATPGLADYSTTLWRLESGANTVFLMGSVHVLRPGDHPLPEAFESAYAQSDVLVMELDMDDLDPLRDFTLFRERGMLENGQTLENVMGASDFQEVSKKASALDIDLKMLQHVKPWYAAITVDQLRLIRLGYTPNLGVEMYFTRKARLDHKEILGLETTEYQIGLFDEMTTDTQEAFLLASLDDRSAYETRMNVVIEAWRNGETDRLYGALHVDFVDYPELYQALIVTRNRNFTREIVKLLDEKRNYLVIVGAGHLIGEEGIIRMLEDRGISADQL